MSSSFYHSGLQHTRLPCPSPSPRVSSNSYPLSWWCHPTISSFATLFPWLQSFLASGSFPVNQPFASGGQSIGTIFIWLLLLFWTNFHLLPQLKTWKNKKIRVHIAFIYSFFKVLYVDLSFWCNFPLQWRNLKLSCKAGLLAINSFSFCSSDKGFISPLLWKIILLDIEFLSHTVHGVLKARILEWFTIPSSSGQCFVTTLHHDLSILDGPAKHGS